MAGGALSFLIGTKEERFAIQVGLENGRKISAIAKELI
jgi:hypothetical protein